MCKYAKKGGGGVMDRKWIMVDNQVTKGEVRIEHIIMTRSQGEGDETQLGMHILE